MTTAEKDRVRFEFLKELHDSTGGNMRAIANLWEIGQKVGLDGEQTGIVFDSLDQEGLAESMTLGGGICITHAGIVEIEQAERAPQKATDHFPANIINIHGPVTGAAIQVGNINSTQTANITVSVEGVQELATWLIKLKESIPDLGLSPQDTDAIKRNVRALDDETQEAVPDNGVLRTQLGRIQGFLKSVGAHLMAAELLKELPTVLHHLALVL
jgi:hypothetical protein